MALKKLNKNKVTTPTKEERATMVNPVDERHQDIQKQAEENTTIIKKSSGVEEAIKNGTPNDYANRQKTNMVGLSKGITKNMDNYESLRIDCWISVQLKEGEDPTKVLDEISDTIDARLEYEVDKIVG